MKTLTAILALAATTALPTVAAAESFMATMVAGHPPVFRWVKMLDEAFVPAVQEELAGTGHSMNFTGLYGGAIAGVGEELEAVEAGLAEIGICQSLFDPAKLAVQNVTYYTPFVSDNPRIVSTVMDDLHESDPRMRQAYTDNGVVYLGAPLALDDYLLMTNFPVDSLDDLEGRKIGAPGAAINWLSGTGAVGVSGNLTTYYNEIKAGVFDGVLVFASAALPSKLHEVAPHVTRAGLGAQFAGAICVNDDWWEGLPQEVKDALEAGADAASEWYIDALESAVDTAMTTMADQGATIKDASQEMRTSWAEGMDNVAQTWAKDLDALGKPGSEMLDAYMDAMRDAGAEPLRNWDEE
ncbi:C4-dicarboxylate TRAP transporter substrate-binding protein [Tranquillimonas alkanivorans]|uniref:TRAP-type C4-dicarboxylate transport system, substrate-binding protein n=1 Tax=Tranquillimonas alkanivorans TaxID=441119 RepID=A0A1I5VX03_9RHOB|nr:C4-dicarboxylate TRAP transporter substrate-binding protein [Tranquillimonas alkanivorans]SFQ11981.1 TRAP-type C4-dicarboxylate transport system, substrate-binding protein [Tranquillimonas alkanivorans]